MIWLVKKRRNLIQILKVKSCPGLIKVITKVAIRLLKVSLHSSLISNWSINQILFSNNKTKLQVCELPSLLFQIDLTQLVQTQTVLKEVKLCLHLTNLLVSDNNIVHNNNKLQFLHRLYLIKINFK